MQTFALILTVIAGSAETGIVHAFVLGEGLSYEECAAEVDARQDVWLGTDLVGMYCELEGVNE